MKILVSRSLMLSRVSHCAGMSLIEIMFAMALFTGCIVVVSGYFVNLGQANRNAISFEQCVQEANNVAETITNMTWDDLESGRYLRQGLPGSVQVHLVESETGIEISTGNVGEVRDRSSATPLDLTVSIGSIEYSREIVWIGPSDG